MEYRPVDGGLDFVLLRIYSPYIVMFYVTVNLGEVHCITTSDHDDKYCTLGVQVVYESTDTEVKDPVWESTKWILFFSLDCIKSI